MSATSNFKEFATNCKCSWFIPNNNSDTAISVSSFYYHLSQYTPSITAIIDIAINLEDIENFKNIEKLDIKDREVEIWFDNELYELSSNKTYFRGPYKFIVYSYSMTNDISNGLYRSVRLYCMDKIFYNMTLKQNSNSFGEVTVSDYIQKLVSNNGGSFKKLVDTSVSYKWQQPLNYTDYDMIRKLLPYAQSSNGLDCYIFFMMNNEAYFAPIGSNKLNAVTIPANFTEGALNNDNYENKYKSLINKYGSKTGLYCSSLGFEHYRNSTPNEMSMQSYDTDQKNYNTNSEGTTYLRTPFDNEELNNIYINNLRHRVHTFNRVINLQNIPAIPDITPLECIKIDNKTDNGKPLELSGVYYVLEVEYFYGSTHLSEPPKMNLVLSTENDIVGTEEAEGQSVVSSPENILSVAGVDSAKNNGTTDLLSFISTVVKTVNTVKTIINNPTSLLTTAILNVTKVNTTSTSSTDDEEITDEVKEEMDSIQSDIDTLEENEILAEAAASESDTYDYTEEENEEVVYEKYDPVEEE